MGLEAVVQRIANSRGHSSDAVATVAERDHYCAIKITDSEVPKKSYAFVLNFFNQEENYADFFAFGITLNSTAAAATDDPSMLSLLDELHTLVDRREFVEGAWDLACTTIMDRPMVSIDHPRLSWGFHVNAADNVADTMISAAKFYSGLTALLDKLNDLDAQVWEHPSIED